MRARTVAALMLLAVAALGYVVFGNVTGSSGYRVGAVFDTARGIAPGSVVKIAGATVGEVDDVRLTAKDQALVVMRVSSHFKPFRADATCEVRPEGLIGVRSIDCDPGTAPMATLASDAHGLPVVPLARTQVPVDITDFFSIWAAPTRDRLRLLLNEFGAGLAGRGDDLNAVLLRANPALVQARKVLAILDHQRSTLRSLVGSSDVVLKQLARHAPGLQATLREASETLTDTALRHVALGASIHGLPATLARSRAATRQLTQFASAAVPVLGDLRASAPATERLLSAAPSFAAEARPALHALDPLLRTTQTTLVRAKPFATRLASFTKAAVPAGTMLDQLLVNARSAGVVEYLMRAAYVGAALTSRYDALSHLFPSGPQTPGCNYDSTPDPACEAHYAKQAATRRAARVRAHRHVARRPAAAQQAPAAASPGDQAPPSTTPSRPVLPIPLPSLPATPSLPGPVGHLLHYLLGA